MRKIKKVLRVHSLGLRQQRIARSCAIPQSTVHEYLKAAETVGLSGPEVAGWDHRPLEEALVGRRPEAASRRQYPPLDLAAIQQELRSHQHVTLQ
ncbi:MAG: hypothetical protein AAB403_09720 [Planctomycetota bacterium]